MPSLCRARFEQNRRERGESLGLAGKRAGEFASRAVAETNGLRNGGSRVNGRLVAA